jgi:multidrug efflux pump subunit AcrA (membrane-fusion protein)
MIIALLLSLPLIPLTACSKQPEKVHAEEASRTQQEAAGQHTEDDGHNPAEAATDPNAISIPDNVQQNLRLSFVKAERRRVASTLRVPGRFEPLPSSRREYNAILPGRVELLVQQYQPVDAGTPLYRIESPEWLKLRQQLQEELSAISRSEAEVAVAQATRTEAEKAVTLLEQRVSSLGEAGVRKAELEAGLADKRNSLPRLEAEVRAKQAEHQAARQRFPLSLASAASVTGMDPQALMENVGDGADAKPRWTTIDAVEIRATQAGVVESMGLTNGAWTDANKMVLAVVDPGALRFCAVSLQADLGKLRNDLPASIVPPRGSKLEAEPLPGKLMVGLAGDPESRTIELVVTPEKLNGWARAGVSAFLEVSLDDSEEPEVAIPTAAVIQDELNHIFFRRDPANPDRVIRTEADLGTSDGHWVIVNSGIKAGDEVVVEGVYELKLASSAKGGVQGKGHFHADGTYVVHEGNDGEKK